MPPEAETVAVFEYDPITKRGGTNSVTEIALEAPASAVLLA